MKNGREQRETPVAEGAAGGSGLSAGPEEQHGTRRRVARSILDHGPSTAGELAARLGLTQPAVRRHLDALVAEGVVEPREKRVYGARGRGRPAKVFALTDCGRDAFDHAYDELAVEALRWIERAAGGGERGAAAVLEFARAKAAAQAEQYRPFVERAARQDRTRALAEALSQHGYAAAARAAPAAAGEQLCQHHCPVAHAAERFPQLCEAETEAFSDLLGTHVQRLATIAHGDGVCTTFVPEPTPGPGREPATGSVSRSATESAAEPAAEPAATPVTEPVTEPVRPVTRPVTTTTHHLKTTARARNAGRNPA